VPPLASGLVVANERATSAIAEVAASLGAGGPAAARPRRGHERQREKRGWKGRRRRTRKWTEKKRRTRSR
jgi:hypothetical protein